MVGFVYCEVIKVIMNLIIVVSHFNDDLSWIVNQTKYDYIVYSKNESSVLQYKIEPSKLKIMINRGMEASAYLKFIIDNYNNLPDHVAFCHGHEFSWHQAPNKTIIDHLIGYNGEEYYPLNDPYNRNLLHDDCLDPRVWSEVKQCCIDINLEIPSKLEHTHSSQFIVTKQCILNNPVYFYLNCYNWLMNQTVMSDYNADRAFEQLWYYLLTGKNIEPRWCGYVPSIGNCDLTKIEKRRISGTYY